MSTAPRTNRMTYESFQNIREVICKTCKVKFKTTHRLKKYCDKCSSSVRYLGKTNIDA